VGLYPQFQHPNEMMEQSVPRKLSPSLWLPQTLSHNRSRQWHPSFLIPHLHTRSIPEQLLNINTITMYNPMQSSFDLRISVVEARASGYEELHNRHGS
jgi:hypothetical protein